MIELIAAVDENYGIGIGNWLPWGNKFPEDLQHFRKITLGRNMIAGVNTVKSLPDLDNRRLFLTRGRTSKDIQELLKLVDNPIIIGGAKTYELAMPYVEKMHITHIPGKYPCDTFFPHVEWRDWRMTDSRRANQLVFETWERD